MANVQFFVQSKFSKIFVEARLRKNMLFSYNLKVQQKESRLNLFLRITTTNGWNLQKNVIAAINKN